jgi:hypothetical protein
MPTKITGVRFTDETLRQLDELCRVYGLNRREWLQLKIAQEYDAMQGNPKLKAAIEALNECEKILKATRPLQEEG